MLAAGRVEGVARAGEDERRFHCVQGLGEDRVVVADGAAALGEDHVEDDRAGVAIAVEVAGDVAPRFARPGPALTVVVVDEFEALLIDRDDDDGSGGAVFGGADAVEGVVEDFVESGDRDGKDRREAQAGRGRHRDQRDRSRRRPFAVPVQPRSRRLARHGVILIRTG